MPYLSPLASSRPSRLPRLAQAACLVSTNRRFWTSPRGVMLNAARIFVVREVAWVTKEIQAL
jgi:hypothetical protein